MQCQSFAERNVAAQCHHRAFPAVLCHRIDSPCPLRCLAIQCYSTCESGAFFAMPCGTSPSLRHVMHNLCVFHKTVLCYTKAALSFTQPSHGLPCSDSPYHRLTGRRLAVALPYRALPLRWLASPFPAPPCIRPPHASLPLLRNSQPRLHEAFPSLTCTMKFRATPSPSYSEPYLHSAVLCLT